jgi:phenylalanyl-tRNA synthetase beta chain
MNISYNWLKDLISIEMSSDDLAQKLTRVGLAVEGIHPSGDDFVLDIDLTSNRPDCLSHLGIARELRVISNSQLNTEITSPKLAARQYDGDPPLVTISDGDLCNRFTGRIIRNLKIGPSPDWLVKRLEAVGERSINNVADITNYVMLELGQPMHAFDLDRLAGHRIVVRRARSGETIQTLDGVERKLEPEMLAICDADKPAAIGGVMGGLASSITEETKNVLLEVAYFKRENIRQTSRRLNLATEASYRFERGVDIENLINASNRATTLICELAGGTAEALADVYPETISPNQVRSNDIVSAVKRLTGLTVERTECLRILDALGIHTDDDGKVFPSPTWRHDIAIEEDLVEEVARHVGYENIGTELPPAVGAGEYQATEVRKKLLRRTLVDLGFDEAISYSFIDTNFDEIFELVPQLINEQADERFVTLRDAVIEGAVRMRPTILPGILDAVRLNFNQQRRDLKLFEIGRVFAVGDSEDGLPAEQELLAVALTGGEVVEAKANPVRELDFFDAKGAIEAALEAIGVTGASFTAADVKHLRRGQSASVSIDGEIIGYLGKLSDQISTRYKFRQPVFVAEIDLQRALAAITDAPIYRPLGKYPSITRDVSLVVDRKVTFEDIRRAIVEQERELCRSVSFVDVFEGSGLGDNERSITIRLEYRSDERTLVEAEVEEVHSRLINELEQKTTARQRI